MGLILLICFEQYFEQHNFVCVCKHLLNMLYHILSVRVNIVFILSKFVSSVMLVFCTYRSFKHVNVPDLTQPCNEESYLSYPKAFIDGLSDYLLFFLHLHQCWNTQNTKQQWLLIYIYGCKPPCFNVFQMIPFTKMWMELFEQQLSSHCYCFAAAWPSACFIYSPLSLWETIFLTDSIFSVFVCDEV